MGTINKLAYSYMVKSEVADYTYVDPESKDGFWGNRGAGVLFLAKDSQRVLLLLRSKHVNEPHTWGIAGGAVDDDETPLKAAKREVREEISYKGKMQIFPSYIFQKGGFKYYNYIGVVNSEFRPILTREAPDYWETDKYQWFDLNDLPSPLHPGCKVLFREAMEQIQEIINSFENPSE
jgi:8-oxo-dGTP pyrophosphatase MutT (NUDIX family)